MIVGKYITDSQININFTSKEVNIDYAFYKEEGIIPKLHPFFNLIFSLYFNLIHKIIIIPLAEKKLINIDKYLTSLNSFYKLLFGVKIIEYEAPYEFYSIVIFSENNLEFKYELTGDFELYCESIELIENNYEVNWLGKSYYSDNGWFFIINFSDKIKTGTAKIKYL